MLQSQEQNDEYLTDLFKNLEKYIHQGDKTKMDWTLTTDFKVFSEFLVKDIKEMKLKLKNPDDEYLYYACQHIFNILDWIKLIVQDAGFTTFSNAWENLFGEQFGDKYILQNMYNDCFEKWVSGKTGQYKIEENFYNILKNKLYYRNRFGKWFEIDKTTAFDLRPKQELFKDNETIESLNNEYRETWYDSILKQWENNEYQGKLPADFMKYKKKETSPDEYFDFSIMQVQKLLANPVSINELEQWNGGEIAGLEHLVKVASFVLGIARKRRKDQSHTLYLLRDCLIFNEAQKILDSMYNKSTSSDQILIGRKLLSNKPGFWGYYAAALDALYTAHLRYPTNFTEFYQEYSRLLDLFVSLNPKFADVVANLTKYIKQHIQTDKNKIIIFDIGFQGSIALLTKYIIDHHIKPSNRNIETDIEIGIGAQWSKKLYGKRFDGDYFPMLNNVQLLARSNELYHFKEGSLSSGKLQVELGDHEEQRQAAIELAVLAIVALITASDK